MAASSDEAASGLARPRAAARSLIGPAIFTLVGVALLCGLGVWQLERLAWKQALLADYAERVGAAPVPFPPESAWASLTPDKDEYLHVRLAGRFLNDKEAHLQANLVAKGPGAGALGYDILTPLRLADGSARHRQPGLRPPGPEGPRHAADGEIDGDTTVAGLVRFPQPHPWFVPADDPTARTSGSRATRRRSPRPMVSPAWRR